MVFFKKLPSVNRLEKQFERLSHLREIHMPVFLFSNKRFLSVTKHCPDLTTLHVGDGWDSRGSTWASIADLKTIGLLTSLQCLTIIIAPNFSDEVLEHIVAGCKHLSDVTLSYVRKVTDKGLEMLSKADIKLTKLSLASLEFSPAGLCCIGDMRYLRDLRLRFMGDLPEDFLVVVAAGCPVLKNLEIHLSDSALMGKEGLVPVAGLQQVSKQLTSLERLILDSDTLRDCHLEALSDSCSIHTLNLMGGRFSLPALRSMLTDISDHLTAFKVYTSHHEVAILRQQFPQINITKVF